ncbi:hypothetical protein [Breoghania sp.]|uniref:hypothetical protein n=1 Tax=Breoghania sp. TaxID=2065378 RepID=UPI00263030B7|nr:hypothetical protein [Breoghania sp.]MDJ0933159.1 hypothetical protein [Breoghania sp.]
MRPGATEEGEAPHLNLMLFARGMLVHAYTRVYFSDEPQVNAADEVIQSVPEGCCATLVAGAPRDADRPGLPLRHSHAGAG